ncbi:MAG: non-ribosomal peptide synthetase, partial [bacterium]|nr:non-ribosomal peptide synthetase [bacterium]
GRIDFQVKIRGFRIELGEIESRLVEHDTVNGAVITALITESGDRVLCAYIVKETGADADTDTLREFLALTQPDYMIPATFMFIDKIPLTTNGKVDKKALPVPEIVSTENYIAPRNKGEKLLAGIFARVLAAGEKQIGIDDNFFQLGGHSLKATQVVSEIHKAFNRKISLAQVFKTPT